MEGGEEDEITDIKDIFFAAKLVGMMFLRLLREEKVIAGVLNIKLKPLDEEASRLLFGEGVIGSRCGQERGDETRGTAHAKMKGRIARGRVHGAHEFKTDAGEGIDPAHLLSVVVESKGLDDSLIGALGDTIGLRVEGRGELEFDAGEFVKRVPKVRKKEMVAVGENTKRESIFAIPVIEEKFGEVFGSNVGAAGDEADIRRELVGNGAEVVVTVVEGEGANEIDENTITAFVCNREGMKGARCFGTAALVALALVTGLDVRVSQVMFHFGPVKGGGEGFVGFGDAVMA